MKNFTLTVLFAFACAFTFAQDTIANAGFENWIFDGTYSDPADWTTLNGLTNTLSIYTVYQDSTVVHSGKYAAKAVTKLVEGHTAPGTLAQGVGSFNANTYGFSGGQPIHSRPASVNGWYQYHPVGVDTAAFSITLTRWSTTGDSEVVVGKGSYLVIDSVPTWQQFSFNVTYSSDSVPDSALIVLFSSNSVGNAGSTLYADDLGYSYFPASVKEVENKLLSVYPNPASGQFMIDNSNIHATSLNLYSAEGKLIKVYSLNGGTNTLYTTGLSTGTYIIRAIDNNGAVYTNSIVIEK